MVTVFSWDSEPLEIQSGLIAVLWGVWLVSPSWHSFASCPHLYTVMASIMGERAWGVLLLSVGSLQLLAVWMGSVLHQTDRARWQRRFTLRRLMALLAMLTWLFVALVFATGDWPAPSAVLYVATAFSAMVTYLRLSLVGLRA